MSYKIVESSEIVWCPDDDRYIIIFRQNGEVIGLNYMQGSELIDFRKHYCKIDEDLTNFYEATRVYLGGECELDRINQAIWAHFDYRNIRDLTKFNNK
jgi:hypothetical protein